MTVGGIGRRDGFTEHWRVRLVATDGTVVRDHELVVVRVGDRDFVARTKVAADQIGSYDRVHVEAR